MKALEAGIISANATRLAEFYVKALGFEIVKRLDYPEGLVYRLANGAALCKIFQPVSDAPIELKRQNWREYSGFSYAALHVEDADAVVESARAHGAAVISEPRSHRPGARFAMIADPDGNIFEILEES